MSDADKQLQQRLKAAAERARDSLDGVVRRKFDDGYALGVAHGIECALGDGLLPEDFLFTK